MVFLPDLYLYPGFLLPVLTLILGASLCSPFEQAPSPRSGHQMVVSSVGDVAVVYGGYSRVKPTPTTTGGKGACTHNHKYISDDRGSERAIVGPAIVMCSSRVVHTPSFSRL